MQKSVWVAALACCAAIAADRTRLNGTWQLDSSQSQVSGERPKSETLTIDQKDGSFDLTQAIVAANGSEEKFDIQCNTLGRECKLKEDGRPVQVSAWYNGPALVVMETHGSNGDALKKRFTASEDGKTLSLEVVHITPPGAAERYTFVKQGGAATAANAAPPR